MELNPPIPLTSASPDLLLRLGGSALAGLALGIDREVRGHGAGLRTNAIVCVSGALVTVTAIALFHALSTPDTRIDPLRGIEGMATVVGVISAALIFRGGRSTHNVTTAVHLWLVAAIGVAFGAGFYPGAVIGTGIAIVLTTLMRLVEGKPLRRGDRGEH